jgi:cytochrome c biogenesis protein CcmG/thiol:disulfide interchange protein DsbE
MFDYRKRKLLGVSSAILVCVALIVTALVGMRSPARADDEATRIYKLARALHDENIQISSYTSWVNGDIGRDPSTKPDGLNVGQDMPDFKFSDFEQRSTKFTPASVKPPYLMNFWASWCAPCRAEFPLITKNSVEGKLTIPVYFVNISDTKADAELFLLTYPTTLQILVDERNAFPNSTKMAAIPQTVLIDANGKVQAIQSGGMTETALAFFVEIAANPGVGAFDRQNPDQLPSAVPPRVVQTAAATDSVTATDAPTVTP